MLRALESMNTTIHAAKKCYFIGDTESDVLAGHNAGCKTIFVLSGREDLRYMRRWQVNPDYVAKDLLAAARIITKNHSS